MPARHPRRRAHVAERVQSQVIARADTSIVDTVRIGLALRELRHRRGWTQTELARRCGVSRGTVWRIERGAADRVALHLLIRVAAALGASVSTRILWHGEALDRLLDDDPAALTDAMLALLHSEGWEVATEVPFNRYGDRGSIDILAFHPGAGCLLVVEIKSVVPDVQAMLGTLDRKVRVAQRLAEERGWVVRSVSRLLVLPDQRTPRRRVDQHRSTFDVALPAGTIAVRRWLRAPAGTLAGILFLSDARHPSARHRVATRPPSRRARSLTAVR